MSACHLCANRGMGGASERDRRWLILMKATLGVYTNAGVAKESLPQVSTVAELVEQQLIPDMEVLALVKGLGILLYDKWSKVYKMSASHGRFAQGVA